MHPSGMLSHRQALIKLSDARLFFSVIINIAIIADAHMGIQISEISADKTIPCDISTCTANRTSANESELAA